jgi:hypothetical protein
VACYRVTFTFTVDVINNSLELSEREIFSVVQFCKLASFFGSAFLLDSATASYPEID